MSTDDVALILRFALIAWIGFLFTFVAVKILRGDINTNGLLSPSQTYEPGPGPSKNKELYGERLALVVLTVAAAGYYLLNTLGTPIAELCDPDGSNCFMPDIPEELLVLLGGSQSAYLTGKILPRKRSLNNDRNI